MPSTLGTLSELIAVFDQLGMETTATPTATTPSAAAASELHVLLFPFPIQGHLNCMLHMARLLALSGIHVTFLHTEFNLHRIREEPPEASQHLRFLSIPDGLPQDDPRSVDGFLALAQSLETKARPFFKSLLLALSDKSKREEKSSDRFPPLSCVISDGIMPFAIDTAEEVGLPAIAFRTASACSFWAYCCIPQLIQNGEIPLPDGADLDAPIQSIAGMEKFLRRRDLPSPLRNAKHRDDPWLQFVCNVAWHSKGARALILNTSESLESGALSHICDHMPVTFPIGPLHQMLRSCTNGSNESSLGNAISLWHEDHTCMTWLDAQPDQSVVYVSYGSLTTMSKENLMQFWVGLINSGHRFLWVLRSNLVGEEEFGIGAEMEKLVKQGTEERGCIVSWAPQQQVLAHRAVGCFLTHSGWNSTLESMVEGVPMICWPFFVDQQLNSRFVSEVWRVGLDMKDASDANTIETTVRAAMQGETARQLRRNALEFAQQLRKDVSEGGSSFQNFQRLVEYIKSFTHQH